MPSFKPVVESWHGIKLADGTGEVVLLGYGFGVSPGSVKLNVQGVGVVNAPIKRWSEGAVVVSAPADSTVMRAHVYIVDSRGKEKQGAQSPPGQVRITDFDAAGIPWSIDSHDDNEDNITVTGTGLSAVEDVVLYDSATPQNVILASHLMNGSDLEVDWPASYVSPIKKMRLSDANGNKVEELVERTGGWTRVPNGVVTSVTAEVVGGAVILNVLGSGFGSVAGSVELRKVGGLIESVPILSGGWSDSLVQVVVDGGSSYDLVRIIRDDLEVAEVSSSVQLPILTPSGAPVITSITSFPLGIRVEGSGFNDASYLLTRRAGEDRLYDREGWFGKFGAEFSDSVIEIKSDYGVDNLAPVDAVRVITTTGASELVVAPDLGGPWGMDDPDTASNQINVVYNSALDQLEITGTGDLFQPVGGWQVDGVTYDTVEFGAGYSWSRSQFLPLIDSNTMHVRNVSAGTVGSTITNIKFYNNAGLMAVWEGSVVVP